MDIHVLPCPVLHLVLSHYVERQGKIQDMLQYVTPLMGEQHVFKPTNSDTWSGLKGKNVECFREDWW